MPKICRPKTPEDIQREALHHYLQDRYLVSHTTCNGEHRQSKQNTLELDWVLDDARSKMSLASQKVFALMYDAGLSILEVKSILGCKHRVDAYRRKNTMFNELFLYLGKEWI